MAETSKDLQMGKTNLGILFGRAESRVGSGQWDGRNPSLRQESVEIRSTDGVSDHESMMVNMRPRYHAGNWKDVFSVVFWEGGSGFDAWLTSSSVQVVQVLLTLPYSFSQLGIASGIAFQVFYGFVGCWTCFMITSLYADHRNIMEKQNISIKNHTIQWYEVLGGLLGPWWRAVGLFFGTVYLFCIAIIQLIACGSMVYYINDSLSKRTWTLIFGAIFILTVFIPTAYNYRMWSLVGILMTTYTAWYMTISAATHGQAQNVQHSAPKSLIPYFTGATNLLFTFGGHSVTVEIMHAMWRPRQFKLVYLYTVLYILSLTIPSASAMYWAFGDLLIDHANAFGVLPRNKFRDAAVIVMLMHQNAIEQPPSWVRNWTNMYIINIVIVIWMVIIGFGFGSWASISNIIKQVHTFGLFVRCYQCPKK